MSYRENVAESIRKMKELGCDPLVLVMHPDTAKKVIEEIFGIRCELDRFVQSAMVYVAQKDRWKEVFIDDE